MLEEIGFEINPYDKFIVNKTINGKQCTITCYVDDNKISHKEKNVTDEVIENLEKKLGKFKITNDDTYF